MTGVAELLLTDGVSTGQRSDLIYGTDDESARRRGVKQGIRMIMLMLVLAPVIGLISRFVFGIIPWPMGVVVFLLGGGGLLRVIYALLFESKFPASLPAAAKREPTAFAAAHPTRQLNENDSSAYVPASLFGTPDTNDLHPGSVTEGTTRLLEKERE